MDVATTGPLVIADIAGYTAYLQGVELEHASDVLSDLLGTVAATLGATVPVAKLEGDAVFCAGEDDACDGTALLTAIVDTYVAFRRRQRAIAVATSCGCDACRRIPELELKLVVHRGQYVAHEVAGSRELTGPDVVLVHRLLKNAVGDSTGLRGYAWLTAAACAGLDHAALADHAERVDDIGEVAGKVVDLETAWSEADARAVVRVHPADALLTYEAVVRAAPEEVWRVHTEPAEQPSWRVDLDRYESASPGGVRGVGTSAHCVHGRTTIMQEIVDWKPHAYYSYRERNPGGRMLWTVEVEPAGDGARVRWLVALDGGPGQRVLVTLIGRRMRRILQANFDSLVARLGG